MSISVSHVTKLYGQQKALDDVSFSIGGSAVVGFLGPNGAGKSTMMKILTCYLPASEGTASVCGFDTREQSMDVRRSVGYLPEHNPLYTDLYVKEYLEFVAGIYTLKNVSARVKEMVDTVGLGREQHKKIGQLSRGYRQRVGLAQAMIHDPKVLILDEPTSGLDPNQLEEVRGLIKRIGREKTVLLSTHIMQEVEAICDRVIIIDRGRIVADDTADTLRSASHQREVLEVEFDRATEAKGLLGIPGVEKAEAAGTNAWRLVCRTEQDARPAVFQFAVDNGLKVLALQKSERGLEEVFKELTNKGIISDKRSSPPPEMSITVDLTWFKYGSIGLLVLAFFILTGLASMSNMTWNPALNGSGLVLNYFVTRWYGKREIRRTGSRSAMFLKGFLISLLIFVVQFGLTP
jgi:ABC-2 type transport system ATP-binding protein